MTQDLARSVAFDERAPANERQDALAELQKSAMPSETLSTAMVAQIMQFAEMGGGMGSMMPGVARDGTLMMTKAIKDNTVPSPGPFQGKQGMQSVRVDDRHQQLQGEFWEKPAAMNFKALRAMTEQTPILNAVILTRVRQVQRFCNIQEDGAGIGFQVCHIDREHQIADDERESIKMLNRFIQKV